MITRTTMAVLVALSVASADAFSDPLEYGQRSRGESVKRSIFPGNQFTFCRIRYTDWGDTRDYDFRGRWRIDYPESDQHFSQRLNELTTIKVRRDKHGRFRHVVLRLTDEELFDYPFIYIIEPGELHFTDEEVERLRSYLLRGGFLMVDDFWGEREWDNWEIEIRRIFPAQEYPIVELPLSHPIFNCVFVVTEKPQVPSLYFWRRWRVTSERSDSQVPHYRGIFDAKGRLMTVMCHNTDLGDGWEREGENHEYFREFSAKKAYPMGINIVVYAMTH